MACAKGRRSAQIRAFPRLRGRAAHGYAAPPGAVLASKIINTVNLMSGAAETDLQRFLTEHPEVKFFDAFVNDLNTVERGKRIDRGNIAGIFKRGMPLPGSMFALDIEGGTVEATGLGFADGDADRPCMPIPKTLVPVPWQPEVAQGSSPCTNRMARFFGDPRHLLRMCWRVSRAWRSAGGGHRIRVLLVDVERDPRESQPQPPKGPLTGRRNSAPRSTDDGSQRVLPVAPEIDASVDCRMCRPPRRSPNTVRDNTK
jgi:hypothetical protein